MLGLGVLSLGLAFIPWHSIHGILIIFLEQHEDGLLYLQPGPGGYVSIPHGAKRKVICLSLVPESKQFMHMVPDSFSVFGSLSLEIPLVWFLCH